MSFAATIEHPARLYPIDDPPPQANVLITLMPFFGTRSRSDRFQAQSGFSVELKAAVWTFALELEIFNVDFFCLAIFVSSDWIRF